eukprot:1333506-Prymnesium_polylepis.1
MLSPNSLLSADQSVVELASLWETGYHSMEVVTWLIESVLQDNTLRDIYASLSKEDLNEVRMLAHRMSEDLSRIHARPAVRALRKAARKPVSGVEEMRSLVDEACAHSQKLMSELKELTRVMDAACPGASGGARFSEMSFTMRRGARCSMSSAAQR